MKTLGYFKSIIFVFLFLSADLPGQPLYWSARPSGSSILRKTAFVSSTTGWAVGTGGAIMKTTDGGNSWISQSSGVTTSLWSVSFASATTGWVAGDNGVVLKTTDAGSNWTVIRNTGQVSDQYYSVVFVSATNGWVAGYLNEILYTTNGGSSWTTQSYSPNGWPYRDFYFVSSSIGWVVGISSNGGPIKKTINAGSAWVSQNAGTTNFLSSIFFVNATTGWAVGDYGTIVYTTNGGTNWNLQSSGTSQDLNSVYFKSSTEGWVAGDGGILLYTSNGGANWSIQSIGSTSTIQSVTILSNNLGMLIDNGVIKKGFPYSVSLTSPSSNLQVIQGQSVPINWSTTGTGAASVSIRRDIDQIWENGNESWISVVQPTSGTTNWSTSSVTAGTYYIAAMVTDGTEYDYKYSPYTVTISVPLYSVSGTVKNSESIGLEGMTVRATNTSTSATYDVATASGGSYTIPNLPSGNYNLSVLNSADYEVISPLNPVSITSNTTGKNFVLTGKAKPSVRMVSPTSFIPGTPFSVTFYLMNISSTTSTLTGYLDISFPENPSITVTGKSAEFATPTVYPVGSIIYGKTGQMTSQHVLASGAWSGTISNMAEKYITIQITPSSSASSINVRYRGTIADNRDPGSGTIDQQGWYVSEWSIPASAPSAPTANAAANITSTSFTANWSSVSGAAGYYLDISTSSSFASFISGYSNLDAGNSTSRNISSLSSNTTYYYRLRAYNSGGTSVNSGTMAVSTLTSGPTVLLNETFESVFPASGWFVGNDGGVTTAKWGDNYATVHTGSWSAFCADAGSNTAATYPNDLHTHLEYRSANLYGYSSASLDFWYAANCEANFDYLTVNIKDQSGTWTEAFRTSSSSGVWQKKTIDLSAYCGQTGVYIQFRFDSDASNSSQGVWIDDVLLTGTTTPNGTSIRSNNTLPCFPIYT